MKKVSMSKLMLLIFFAVIFIGSIVLVVIARKDEDTSLISEIMTDTVTSANKTSETTEQMEAAVTSETTTTTFETFLFYSYHDERKDTQNDDENEEYDEPEEDIGGEPIYTEDVPAMTEEITHRDRSYFSDTSAFIDIENIKQLPELPTGCEITALTILLRSYGFDADKTDLARSYLPKTWGNPREVDGVLYKDSFFDYFIGDPFSNGYGCFSGAIETAAERYIADNGGGYSVNNISGCSPDTLYDYVSSGVPVLCWATDGMIAPEYYETWYDNDTGERLDWYLNEHCFVLVGYDMDDGTVTLNDPMKGVITYNIDKFETRFKQMYSQAIVLKKNKEEYTETAAETKARPKTETQAAQQNDDPIVEKPADISADNGGFEDIVQTLPDLEPDKPSDIFDTDFPVFEDIPNQ